MTCRKLKHTNPNNITTWHTYVKNAHCSSSRLQSLLQQESGPHYNSLFQCNITLSQFHLSSHETNTFALQAIPYALNKACSCVWQKCASWLSAAFSISNMLPKICQDRNFSKISPMAASHGSDTAR